MQTINQLLETVDPQGLKASTERLKKPSEPLTAEQLKVILQKLSAMGHMTINVDAMTVKTWIEGLQDMSPEMLKNGLKKAMEFTGYMTLPAFRELCRFQPEDFGIPNVRQAFDLIYKTQFGKTGDLGHPVVYHAMRECGVWDLKNLGEQEAYRKFEYHYDAMSKRYMAGEKLDIPVVQAIPEKVERERTPQEMEELKKRNIEAMEKLKELFK